MNFNKIAIIALIPFLLSGTLQAWPWKITAKKAAVVSSVLSIGYLAYKTAQNYGLGDWISNKIHGTCNQNIAQANNQLQQANNQVQQRTQQVENIYKQLNDTVNQNGQLQQKNNELVQAQSKLKQLQDDFEQSKIAIDNLNKIENDANKANNRLSTQNIKLLKQDESLAKALHETKLKNEQIENELRKVYLNDAQQKKINQGLFASIKEQAQQLNDSFDLFGKAANHKLDNLEIKLREKKEILDGQLNKIRPLTDSWNTMEDISKSDHSLGNNNIPVYKTEKSKNEQIELGNKLLFSILKDDSNLPKESQEDYLKSIIAVMWSLYDQGKVEFDEGTFVIQDKGFKLYNFLLNYVKEQNSYVKGDKNDPLNKVSYNPFAYSRDCTHFVNKKKIFPPYGIDIRFGTHGWEQPLLPALKKHILFGKIDPLRELIYIKPENHGLYYWDGLPGHGTELAAAQARKSPMIKGVAAYCGYDLGSDDAINYRKERTPVEFLKSFETIMQNDKTLTSDEKKLLLDYVKTEGIKVLTYEMSKNIPALQELKAQYEKEFDHLDLRYGREVILKTDDILQNLSK